MKSTVIAITGGIGSGKSTALKIVEKLGYKSFNADLTYKNMLEDAEFVKEVSSVLGVEPLTENGKITLNRKAISTLVFQDSEALKRLNSFTHPKIMQNMLYLARNSEGLVFCEVPLLFEGKFQDLFDYVFIIKRNDDDRFNSVVLRDGKSIEAIKQIAKNQCDYSKIYENGHTFIIENDGDEGCLEGKLKVVINKIKK